MTIRFPNETEHVAIAGMTGSGKTVSGLSMLAERDMDGMAWVVIDHKRDDNIKVLPAEKINPGAMILPRKGLHVLNARMGKDGREEIETFLARCFDRGKIGLYVDEGHLLGSSEAVRNIMVAGRSKRVPMMWTSQRAHWIDPFIWSQSSFYRVFQLQTVHDRKRFEENFPIKWRNPDRFHSYYYDVGENKVSYLKPSPVIEVTAERLDKVLKTQYRAV